MKPITKGMLIAAVSTFFLSIGLQSFNLESSALSGSSNPLMKMVRIPAGEFEMGDHHDLGGREHPSDETPIHKVRLDSFFIGVTEITNAQYCRFLNAAFIKNQIRVKQGLVYAADGKTVYCDSHSSDNASGIQQHGHKFTVRANRAGHPAVCIRWHGAAAYCNWLNLQNGYAPCYDTVTRKCDFTKNGFRLPTEAEWEYAARGGLHSPYRIFPWGDRPDVAKANWPNSGDPYETGPFPHTTPAGFYNGKLHFKQDFKWPGRQTRYQTAEGANGYGLYDMTGNVWEWVNDWYRRDYYGFSLTANPPGPSGGQPMRDGRPYRVLRSGSWYNGKWGHGRVANRNPSYFRGPDDPDHRWYHIGFRVARSAPGVTRVVGASPENLLAPSVPATDTRNFQFRQPEPRRRQQQPKGRFQQMDTDANGTVSLAELISHEKEKFTRVDADSNGNISQSEMEKDEARRRRNPGRQGRFELMDTNRDGVVSEDEYLAHEQYKFQRLDTDRDNCLTKTEMQTRPPRRDRQKKPDSVNQSLRLTPAPDSDGLASKTVGLMKNTGRSFPGYTLFAPKHNTMTFLIDNQGRAVHQWTQSKYEPGQSVYLLENGNLLRCCFTHGHGLTRGGEGGRLEEYDWDGNLVWEFDYASANYMLHHDIAVLPNGNILALAVERKTFDQCMAAGFNPGMLRDRELYPDYIIEIEPTRPSGGKIVWEWHVWDHLIQDTDRAKADYGDAAAHPERIYVNCNGRPAPAFWNHINSIAYNADLDQIILSVRGSSEIWIIDHSTTIAEASEDTGGRQGKGGGLLYRWGNPAAYRQGTRNHRRLFEQHDAHWIPKSYPGEEHILIFNNGIGRGYSSVDEIAPPTDRNGNYIIGAGSPFGPTRPVWTYKAANRRAFYSSQISGAHRLPDGNTLICAGVSGMFFEVTARGETVWKYINPVVRRGILAQGERPGTDHRGHQWNAVFKVHRYAAHYAGLKNKPLKPRGVIESAASQKGRTGLDGLNADRTERNHRNRNQKDNRPAKVDILRDLGYLN